MKIAKRRGRQTDESTLWSTLCSTIDCSLPSRSIRPKCQCAESAHFQKYVCPAPFSKSTSVRHPFPKVRLYGTLFQKYVCLQKYACATLIRQVTAFPKVVTQLLQSNSCYLFIVYIAAAAAGHRWERACQLQTRLHLDWSAMGPRGVREL